MTDDGIGQEETRPLTMQKAVFRDGGLIELLLNMPCISQWECNLQSMCNNETLKKEGKNEKARGSFNICFFLFLKSAYLTHWVGYT